MTVRPSSTGWCARSLAQWGLELLGAPMGSSMEAVKRGRAVGWLVTLGLVGAIYFLVAYLVLPSIWNQYEHQPGIAGRPMVTQTASGIPGDPLNIGLVGSQDDVVKALNAAGWFPADPVTLRTSIEIVGSVLLDRPYVHAPVSPLLYDGRREDLAYERESGASARRRHHVRLWKVLDAGAEGRPVWLGSATYDEGVGLSHYTGQVTHVIAPDVDGERDFFAKSLVEAGMAEGLYQVSGVGPTLFGRNGEGSRYQTDGDVRFVLLVKEGERRTAPPVTQDAPMTTQVKDAVWQALQSALPKREAD
ncbi:MULTISPECIES: LssY C-terminal domain-containing protein [unclassified Beijerinckia]|uniref:LssY C-terminal domain-containing protein n=1 Tax=unclassified Beijerinckia TaxID=2638183 RepID=UPI0008994F2C|nr:MULTISPECIES: LssY C-terminal domain-containing protein [unclassified Beijerinckia]MDH7797388.1 hypothetical protein [Beijerinckia sp. GAS462]SEC83574.1 LssY C-terminus [Beijerinckia sp. 28-YEA-48]